MSTRDELTTYIAGHLAEDRAGFGSCDYPSDLADALIAEGWRKKPDRHELWNVIDQYTVDGVTALNATDAVLALMDRGQ